MFIHKIHIKCVHGCVFLTSISHSRIHTSLWWILFVNILLFCPVWVWVMLLEGISWFIYSFIFFPQASCSFTGHIHCGHIHAWVTCRHFHLCLWPSAASKINPKDKLTLRYILAKWPTGDVTPSHDLTLYSSPLSPSAQSPQEVCQPL